MLAGTDQITTATPVADPSRLVDLRLVARRPDPEARPSPNGHAAWRVSITKLPEHEKIASSLNYANGDVIATTGGYIGDHPRRTMGHVAVIDSANGRLLHVWNSLCSNRHGPIIARLVRVQ